ncbi:hypothetical protein DRF60_19555 [Chryseobacterium elymi]|uniref:Carboxypeptidase regulatory-like domain-containing protein n=1 Tax=Chryseobacterium elymi TaxID=395936 RepID=A0A3D9D5X7_9FLAO|nr:hypothetical protein [Chryseobacterium elymi]REC73423.1 hypothetical protein DRF60_19555 [Chryseobacterium elymi]
MKILSFVFLLFCFLYAPKQKQYSLELSFVTDSNKRAPNANVIFIKDTKEGGIIIEKVTADNKGVLKHTISEDYFDENGLLIIEASYYNQDTYYFDYHEKLSKKQFPFKKTVVLEHIVPPTLEEINKMNPLPPPSPKANYQE